MVPEDNILTVRELLNRPGVQKLLPPDAQFLWNSKVEEMGDGQPYRALYYLKRRVEMTGEILSDASVTTGQSFENAGQPIVNFTTTSQGVRLFGRVTGANVGERMAIILDDQVYSAPTIRSKISQGSGIIEGTGTVDEAKDLAIVLRAGALPADVNIVEDRTVGPSLGRDSIEQGKNAALIGLVIVIIFMVIYYGFLGPRRRPRPRAQPRLCHGHPRGISRHAHPARHSGYHPNHWYGSRCQRADSRTHPRGIACGKNPAGSH